MDPENKFQFSANNSNLNFSLGNYQLPQPTVTIPNFNLVVPNVNANFQLPNMSGNTTPSVSQNPYSFFTTPLLSEKDKGALGADLFKDVSVAAFKDSVPGLDRANFLLGAVNTGKELGENITKNLAAGQSMNEAVGCSLVKAVAEEGVNSMLKETITAGVPVYLAAAAASAAAGNPALMLSIPVIGALLPDAYNGATVAAQMTGNAAEQLCHDAFSAARQISNGR